MWMIRLPTFHSSPIITVSLPVDLLSEALPMPLEKYSQQIYTSSNSSTSERETVTNKYVITKGSNMLTFNVY